MIATAQEIIQFWYSDDTRPFWFKKDDNFDTLLHERFFDTWEAASRGECAHWRHTIEGRLAEIIVLDQFSRNLWRNSPRAFEQDVTALVLAQECVKIPEYQTLPQEYQHFIIMPFMHSESRLIHEEAVPLFEALGNDNTLNYELLHKKIIDEFGRYPHRNAVLNRASTPDEEQFLTQPNSSF